MVVRVASAVLGRGRECGRGAAGRPGQNQKEPRPRDRETPRVRVRARNSIEYYPRPVKDCESTAFFTTCSKLSAYSACPA